MHCNQTTKGNLFSARGGRYYDGAGTLYYSDEDFSRIIGAEQTYFKLKTLPNGVESQIGYHNWHLSFKNGFSLPKKIVSSLNETWGKVVKPFGETMNASNIDDFHKAGKKVNAWTVDTREGLNALRIAIMSHLVVPKK
jgi:glycerophosphoryl diester phosphodiesterase